MTTTRDDFKQWKQNDTTKWVLGALKDRRDDLVDLIVQGDQGGSAEIVLRYGQKIGAIAAYDDMLNIQHADEEV